MSKTFRYYDFTLTAGGSQVLLVEAAYFRVQSATGAVDVSVEGFGTLPGLLVGQGIKDTPFKRLVIRDASGAANLGTILVASQEFVDNRTYGVTSITGGYINNIDEYISKSAAGANHLAFYSAAIATGNSIYLAIKNTSAQTWRVNTATTSIIGANFNNAIISYASRLYAPSSAFALGALNLKTGVSLASCVYNGFSAPTGISGAINGGTALYNSFIDKSPSYINPGDGFSVQVSNNSGASITPVLAINFDNQ